MYAHRLPGETTARFVLLVLAALTSGFALAESMWFGVYLDEANDALRSCALQFTDLAAVQACGLPQARGRVLWVLAIGVGVLAAGYACAGTASLVRRRGLQPFPYVAAIDAEVVTPSTAEFGSTRPELLWSRTAPIAMARADGLRRHYVEVGMDWAGWAAADPPRARAVLQHEIHHLRARDVLPSRVTWWLPPVVVALAVIYLISLVTGNAAEGVVHVPARIAAVVLVVVLGRTAVLRAREHAADLAALSVEPDGTRRMLAGPATPVPTGGRVRRALRTALATHPSTADRAAVAADPSRAGRIQPIDGVLVGMTAAIGGSVLSRLWLTWFPTGALGSADLAGWGLVGAVLGSWIAVMLFRAVAGERSGGEPVRLSGFCALLALSMLVGRTLYLTPIGIAVEWAPTGAATTAGLVALSLGLVGIVHWLHGVVDWWFDLAAASRPRRAVTVPLVLGAVAGGLTLGVLAGVASLARALESTDGGNRAFMVVQLLGLQAAAGPSLLLILMLAAIPLVLSRLTVRAEGSLPGWLAVAAGRPPRRAGVRVTVCIGVAGGVCAALADIGYAALRGKPDDWFTAAGYAYTAQGLTGGVVALSGLVAALLAPAAPSPRACLAAAVGAVVAAIGATATRDSATSFGFLLVQIVSVGVLGALVGVGVLLSVPTRRDRRRRASAGRLAVVAAGAAVVVVALIQAVSERPSAEGDATQYLMVLNSTRADAELALNFCLQGIAAQDATGAADRSLARLKELDAQPATPQVRHLHDEVVGALTECGNAQRAALANGRSRITADEIAATSAADKRLGELIAQLPT